MPYLDEIIKSLGLTVLTPLKSPPLEVEYACASDLLSNVMATCPGHCLWITVQCHMNVVGVASLLDVQAVVLVGGAVPDQAVLKKAREVGVTLLATHDSAFNLCGRLYSLGIRGVRRHELNQKSGGVL
ncbi:MAG: hypothetical protein DDT37_00651 [Firmicutes bacterium]|nr:hypothetical protein [candidate division NPL-UPA2 bacterium]MBT9154929.1 hypothetical protein [candidate division NPL-UPA2 bacterium]MBT9155683.1 hypothetical protein [candidate division NPL-UPA2 bacterium]